MNRSTVDSAAPVPPPQTVRAFACRCGRPVFFRNSECLACHRPLGYDPDRGLLLALELPPGAADGPWQPASGSEGVEPGRRYWRCLRLDSPAACNWLLAADDGQGREAASLCRCCRLTRSLPDLSLPQAGLWWNRVELAKRRLVSSLIGLKVPVVPKDEDPALGLAFDLLYSAPGAPPVMTGHADGVITLDLHEADDGLREQRRTQLAEPYRTLLGHLRHESGHYYWQRLVHSGPWLARWRQLFGNESLDYACALQQHYESGVPADWNQRFVSAYASSHPWEDWAETWAHYLHLVDTLDTARSFGLDGERVELHYEPFGRDVLADPDDDDDDADDADAAAFLRLVKGWMELTGVLNELSRSMGVADFYPFVLTAPVVRKLYLVHRIIAAAAAMPAGPPHAPHPAP